MALHFGPEGSTDAFLDRNLLMPVALGLQVLVLVLLRVGHSSSLGERMAVGVPSAGVTFVGALLIGVAASQGGVINVARVELADGIVPIAILAAAVAGVLAIIMSRR